MNSMVGRFVVAVLLVVSTGLAQTRSELTQAVNTSQPTLGKQRGLSALMKTVSLDVADMPLEGVIGLIAQRTDVRISYSNATLPSKKLVTLNLVDATVAEALSAALLGTDIDFSVGTGGQIVLAPRAAVQDATGTVVGHVLEARTNKPLPGANVTIVGTGFGAATDADGNYRIERVPPGKYELRASVVGYGKIGKSIAVSAGGETAQDFFLDETAVGLDEVVVTGVYGETRRKEIPADITVVTSKRIAEKNVTSLTDALKGEIPGVFVQDLGESDYRTYPFIRGSLLAYGAPEYAKFFIDGIELSDPTYLSTIDPSSIERVEVIRGPHAAALYGAEATAGVIQIITKKGTTTGLDRPQVNASVSAGYIESSFIGKDVTPSGVAPIETNSSLEITGGKQTLSYRAGISYATIGEWIKNYNSKRLSFSAGLRVIEGPITAEITALWSERKYDKPSEQYRYERWPGLYSGPNWVDEFEKYVFGQSTLGLSVTYRPIENWSHSFLIGQDNSGYNNWQPEPWYRSESDTLVRKFTYWYSRRSVRYNTSYLQRIGEMFSIRLTGAYEYSLLNAGNGYATDIKFDEYGDIEQTSLTTESYYNQDRRTSGYSGVLELGFVDKLFGTISMSGKEDPRGYGGVQFLPPRYGVTYSRDMDNMQFRVRGQYGAGTKPLEPGHVTFSNVSNPQEGFIALDNFDLRPEKRVGWDAGIDAYWGQYASLSLTRFDEHGQGLIEQVFVNQADDPAGTPADPQIHQYQNIGDRIAQGWEVSGMLNLGVVGFDFLTLKANYSYSDNRITKYYSSSSDISPVFQTTREGDRVDGVPAHSGGGMLHANLGKTNVSLDWQFSGGTRRRDDIARNDFMYGNALHRVLGKTRKELGRRQYYVSIGGLEGALSATQVNRAYVVWYPLYFKFSLRAEHELYDGVVLFANIKDLFNNSTADYFNSSITRGRATTVGVRVRY